MIKKVGVLILTIILTPILAGLYGALHDQISYTISPEYFTKFKFGQFGLEVNWFGGERQTAAIAGITATWWTGIFIGIGHGLTGLLHKDYKQMSRVIFKASMITIGVAMVIGLLGLVYGKLFLSAENLNWEFPEDLIDKPNFILVGSMHTFSYFGGLLGLIGGIIYQVRVYIKYKINEQSKI
jgi:hypothetical protein